MVIPVAHDYICGWCWIAVFQTQRLKADFGVEFDWLSYELMPETLPWDDSPRPPEVTTNRPKTPSRFELACAAEGIDKPSAVRPGKMRSHNALEATEYVKSMGSPDEFVYAMYRAYWEEGREIDSLDVIAEIGARYVSDVGELLDAVQERRFADKIVPFDEQAYSQGVYNVPTYWIGGDRYAEQPRIVLESAIRKVL